MGCGGGGGRFVFEGTLSCEMEKNAVKKTMFCFHNFLLQTAEYMMILFVLKKFFDCFLEEKERWKGGQFSRVVWW